MIGKFTSAVISFSYFLVILSPQQLSLAFAPSASSPQRTFHEAAVVALQNEQFDNAIHLLDKATAEIFNTMGIAQKMMGNYQSALDYFMAAIRLTDGFHQNYNAANMLHYITYDSDNNRKDALDTAITLYDKALVQTLQASDDTVSNSMKANIYFEFSTALRKSNRTTESVLALIKAAELDPAHSMALSNSAVTLFHSGFFSDAITAASAALKVNPSHPVLRRNYDVLLQEIDKKKKQ